MNKAFTSLLLASTTALAACGGGGGGDGSNYTPIQVTNLGSVNTAAISNGFASAIQTVSQDGLVDAKETLSIFEWVNANANINTTELAKYNVTVNGTTMSLQEAWYMLKGYKALYFDGKEQFWNDMVTNGQFDDTDAKYVELKAIADNDDPTYAKAIGQGGKSVEDFKTDKGVVTLSSTVTETITLVSDPVVGIPVHVSTTYTDATVDTVLADGRTQHDVVRTNTHTSRTPSTTTTTTYTQYTYTYSDGTTKNAKGAESYANNTTYTTAITTEEVIISTTYTAASSEPVEEDAPVAEETVEVTVVDTVVSDDEVYDESKKVYGTQQTISVEDKTTVEDGYTVVKRYTTYANPYSVYHYYTITTTTVTKYSDGTSKTETATKQKINGPDEKAGTQTTTVEEISRTKIVVEEVVKLGPDHADMGTRTPGYVADATHYQTNEFEYLGSKHLSASNFDNAYSRGWTGKGSTIVIADTGANTAHVDLDDNIKYTKDFTGNGINTSATHGTHVTGIAGAEKNNVGGHGAAFDADIAVAKVSSGTSYSFSNAIKAAEWGKKIDSVAINVSAEVNYDNGFKKSIVQQSVGNYYSTHWYYGTNGYNGSVNEAVKWKNALGDEQVLVKAAYNA